MWGDFVGSSLLTDEGFKRLASDLASGLISIEQARPAGLGAFLLLLLVGTITLAIIGLVRLLVDRPVALFSIVAAVLFILFTIWLYVGGNAV